MKVAVVTPFHQPEDPWLIKCMESVCGQTYANCLHVVVGDGVSLDVEVPCENLHQLTLSNNIGDYGDSPRTLGAIYAFSIGADAVAFLDSDNWFSSDHIESLVSLQRATKAPVVVSQRNLLDLEGRLMGVCPASNGMTFCDTNCLFFTRKAAAVATSWWLIPPMLHPIDDRVIWSRVLRNRHPIARTLQASSNYRTAFRSHYEHFNWPVPESAKQADDIRALKHVALKYRAEAKSILADYEMLLDGRFLRPRPSRD
jgi:glycosyltransferase involved in cell wall biosynthesis